MTNNIDTALVKQFSRDVHLQAQQMVTRTRDMVDVKMVEGEEYFVETLGDLEAIEINGRHQKTVGQDIEHGRRKLIMREFRATLLLDEKDELETLIDPQRNYAQAVARALYKKFDQLVVEAALATVYTGKQGTTAVTFANDGGLTIDATAGFTYEKLLEVNRNFTNNDVGTDIPTEVGLLLTGDEEEDLMGEIELVSGDYTRQMAVENGRLQMAAGNKLIKFAANGSNPILTVNSNTRDCIAMAKGAVCMGIHRDLSIKINERPDLNNAKQVQAVMYMAAVRKEGKLVQKVQTTKTS